MKKKLAKFISISLIFLSFYSCKTVDPCPEEAAKGNAGGLFNTENDEYSPSFLNNDLYYTSLQAGKKQGEKIFVSNYQNSSFAAPNLDIELPIYNIKNSGLPSFYENTVTGETELYFAGVSEDPQSINRDIFYSLKTDGKWSEPIPLENINSQFYESHPSISSNGKILAFTSDRPGSIGDIDIYISFRDGQGTWSEPINAGVNINTEKTEISPFISNDGYIYFASKGYEGEGGYDILASKIDNGNFSKSMIMPFPINTEWDETGPYIWKDKLFLGSNRRGGCGGIDLYSFTLCGPVFLEIQINAENKNLPLEGTFILYDANRIEIEKYEINDSGFLRIPLESSNEYIMQYFNACVPQYVPEQRIITPCNTNATVKLIANFKIPDELEQFNFEKYEVPFFVSGYYKPITGENLNDLKVKFQYNMIGNIPESKYIENPKDKYDQYSPVVEMALKQAADFIFNIIKNLKNTCLEGNDKGIIIKVTGYADPRKISEIAEYQDESIADDNIDFTINRGDKMDNLKLSELRAYFTAKQFMDYLKNYEEFDNFRTKIEWKIIGMGIDENENRENLLKRRVNIEIGVSE